MSNNLVTQGMITLTDLSDPIISDTAPLFPVEDMVWVDTSVVPPVMRIYKNGKWVEVGSSSPIPSDMAYGGFLSSKVEVNKKDSSSIDISSGYFSNTYTSKKIIPTTERVLTPLDSNKSRSMFLVYVGSDPSFITPDGVSTNFVVGERRHDGWYYWNGADYIQFTPNKTHCNVGRVFEFTNIDENLGISHIIMYAENTESMFDLLTGEGLRQGLFTTVDGKVYVNAEFINAYNLRVIRTSDGKTTLYVNEQGDITLDVKSLSISNTSIDEYTQGKVDAGIKIYDGTIKEYMSSNYTTQLEFGKLNNSLNLSVKRVDVMFYESDSPTELTGGNWNTEAPTYVSGKFIWTKTVTTLTGGNSTETDPVCITGAKGDTGDTGTGITSMTEEYAISTDKVNAPTSGWDIIPPTWQPGKYIWTRIKIVYNNPTSTQYTTPICDSSWEAINELEIGGRNILRNTLKFDSKWQGDGSQSVGVSGSPFNSNIKCLSIKRENYTGTTRTQCGQVITDYSDWTKDDTYTLSGYFYRSSTVALDGASNTFYIRFQKDNTSFIDKGINVTDIPTDKWVYLTCTFKVPYDKSDMQSVACRFALSVNGYISVTQPKLEKGNKDI